jgi:hypothetical protein
MEVKQNSNKDVSMDFGGISYFDICTKIATFFGVCLYSRVRELNNKKFEMYLVTAHSSSSYEKVCEYFDSFPLFSTKYLNYLDWKTIHLIQTSRHLTVEDKAVCVKIKANFNSKRTVFN